MARDAADSANEYADNLNSIEPALHSAFVMGAGFVPGPVGALGSGLVDGEITYFETGNVKTALVRGGTTAAVGLAFGKAGKVMGGPLSRFIAGRLSGGAAAAVAGAESKAIASPVLNAIGKTNCFVAGTLVQMADGTTKPIEQVKVGEYVKSRNPQTGATEAKAVTETFQHLAPQVLTLSLTDPRTGTAERITCTPGHPFYVDGKGFVLAGQLGIGTSIVTRAGPALQVTGLTWQKDKAQELAAGSPGSSFGGYTVYNLTVEDDHTFFVGTTGGGTWVHNEECLKTVGRWMHPDELAKMQETGIVQESTSTITHVADPADIEAFRRQAKSGTIYTEFDVPASSLRPTSTGWSRIVGPSGPEGRNAAFRGRPIPQMPPALNINPIATK